MERALPAGTDTSAECVKEVVIMSVPITPAIEMRENAREVYRDNASFTLFCIFVFRKLFIERIIIFNHGYMYVMPNYSICREYGDHDFLFPVSIFDCCNHNWLCD